MGRGVKVYNCAALSGHVTVGDNAIVSGYSLTHPFVRIGDHVMVAGGTRLTKDVPPYMMAVHESECVGINTIGMRRSGRFTDDEIREAKDAYRLLFRSGRMFRQAVEELRTRAKTKTGRAILEFISAESKRGIIGAAKTADPATEFD